jgi:hypothetical protein
MTVVRRSWMVLIVEIIVRMPGAVCMACEGNRLQDRIDLADELHTDGQGALGNGAAKLWITISIVIYR